MEAEAVKAILRKFDQQIWQWVSSDVVIFEIQQTPEDRRRENLLELESRATERISFKRERVLETAALWRQRGLRVFDSLHIAMAELGGVDVFLTTDKKFLSLLRRFSNEFSFKADNPLPYLLEVRKNA